jgi:GxxExxY protein
MSENELATRIIGLAIETHTALGPGLLEKVYRDVLFRKLVKNGLKVEKEKPMPFSHDGITMNMGYRVDLLVENKVVVELKSVAMLHSVHASQTLTYLRLGNYKLGLLINFNVRLLKHGIKRVVNGL